MNNWKARIEAKLAQGKKPTYDELESALLGALEERKLFSDHSAMLLGALEERQALAQQVAELRERRDVLQGAVIDMNGWLHRLAMAYCKNDASKMADIMADFVRDRVELAIPSTRHGRAH